MIIIQPLERSAEFLLWRGLFQDTAYGNFWLYIAISDGPDLEQRVRDYLNRWWDHPYPDYLVGELLKYT